MLVEEYTRQGIPLLDALEQTAELRAGADIDEDQIGNGSEPDAPRAPVTSIDAPPDTSVLSEFQKWNEMK